MFRVSASSSRSLSRWAISLKVGEELFLKQARLCMCYGAAVVVMALDEQGRAATLRGKVRICQRSYKLLREAIKFPPYDIVFDCNVLTIATGLPEHNSYGIDLTNAVVEIKKTCPCVSFSGGLSNLSFCFRGCDELMPRWLSLVEGVVNLWHPK